MFTGIVQSTGQVKSIKVGENFKKFEILVPTRLIINLTVGASVANNGVCLTVVKFTKVDNEQSLILFDVIDETLRVTNLDALIIGSLVNIERSMKVGDEVGGHFVSGHIHTTAKLHKRIDSTDNCQFTFAINKLWQPYLFNKGFIAINGASLTLGQVQKSQASQCLFDVHLIPETLNQTNLALLHQGDTVNIEIDQQTMTLVDSIERIMSERLMVK